MSEEQAMHVAWTTAIVVGLIGLVITLVVTIFFILTLQKALNRCSPENRAMPAGQMWLLLIPIFNLVWNFFVVLNMAKSLGAEFTKRGIAAEPEPGKTLGLAYAIVAAASIVISWIPCVGSLAGIAIIVLWIMYWVKIHGYSNQLAAPATAVPQA
jgi:hypothetical protein